MSWSSAIDTGAWGSRKRFELTKIAEKLPTQQIAPVENDSGNIKGYIVVGSNGQRTSGVLSYNEAARKVLALQDDQMRQLDLFQTAGLQAGSTK